jgi:uncharacterized protein affecting Mg2+/Co2+ transport
MPSALHICYVHSLWPSLGAKVQIYSYLIYIQQYSTKNHVKIRSIDRILELTVAHSEHKGFGIVRERPKMRAITKFGY